MTLNLAERSFKVIHFGRAIESPCTTLYRPRPLIVTFALSSTISEILPVLYAAEHRFGDTVAYCSKNYRNRQLVPPVSLIALARISGWTGCLQKLECSWTSWLHFDTIPECHRRTDGHRCFGYTSACRLLCYRAGESSYKLIFTRNSML